MSGIVPEYLIRNQQRHALPPLTNATTLWMIAPAYHREKIELWETKGISMSMRAIVLSLCTLVLLVGCGGDDGDSNGDATDAPTTAVQSNGESTESTTDSSTDESSSDGSIEIIAVRGGKPNARADATVRAAPNAVCSISFITPDGSEGEDPGLVEKTATGNGRVSWSWRLAADLTPGTGTVTFTCDGESIEAPIEIE